MSKKLAFYKKKMIELEIIKTIQLTLAEPIDDDNTIELIIERTISDEVIFEEIEIVKNCKFN